jgi:sulfite exporter TauE/SafE
MEYIWTALLLGFAGSFHCAGMCGPIVLALNSSRYYGSVKGRMLYHSGRIGIYMALGLLAGIAGHALDFAGIQRHTAIISGVLMILAAVLIYIKPGSSWVSRYSAKIRKLFKNQVSAKTSAGILATGMLNGLLPCGMVYMAAAGSVAAGSIAGSVIYMMVFGLATLPMLIVISIAGAGGFRAAGRISKLAPYLVVLIGLLMIYRGIFTETASCCAH